MDRTRIVAGYRVVFAVLTLAAIAYQAWWLIDRGTFDAINFFSYFTIQSNLIAVAVFLIGAARWRETPTIGWELVRGAALLYMTVTLVVFSLLLSGSDVDTAVVWVNTVVHKLFPLVLLIDWILDPPRHRISIRDSLVWLVYPLAWLAYTMVRGALVGWYPYPFLDPANGGFGTVALYVVAILVFGVVLCAVLATAGNILGDRRAAQVSRDPAAAPPA